MFSTICNPTWLLNDELCVGLFLNSPIQNEGVSFFTMKFMRQFKCHQNVILFCTKQISPKYSCCYRICKIYATEKFHFIKNWLHFSHFKNLTHDNVIHITHRLPTIAYWYPKIIRKIQLTKSRKGTPNFNHEPYGTRNLWSCSLRHLERI